jgi:hypothetical protein
MPETFDSEYSATLVHNYALNCGFRRFFGYIIRKSQQRKD